MLKWDSNEQEHGLPRVYENARLAYGRTHNIHHIRVLRSILHIDQLLLEQQNGMVWSVPGVVSDLEDSQIYAHARLMFK